MPWIGVPAPFLLVAKSEPFFFKLEMPKAVLIISKRVSVLILSLQSDWGPNVITERATVMINLASSYVTRSVGH
jgi:hypothetical protein